MKHLVPVYVFIILLVSCDSNSDNKEQLAVPSALPTTNPISPVSGDTSAILNKDAGVALNPKHGEPGHRCDIAEGAPLNTPAINSSIQPTITPTITPTATPSNTETQKISKLNTATTTLNPKHGEPGHRCDIAVGAPLNSKPTQ